MLSTFSSGKAKCWMYSFHCDRTGRATFQYKHKWILKMFRLIHRIRCLAAEDGPYNDYEGEHYIIAHMSQKNVRVKNGTICIDLDCPPDSKQD